MLKTETIHSLAKILKMEPQDLEAKIKSEGEEDVALPELNVFTKEELDTRLKNEKTGSYNEGKEAGVEMLVKDKKKELGYDFEGKDFDSLLKHHEDKIRTASGKPNERVAELENDIKKINQTHLEAIKEREGKISDFQNRLNQTVIKNQLLSITPKETTIPTEDVIDLFNLRYQTELDESGKIKVKQNGETLKDPTTASERELQDVYKEFVSKGGYEKRTAGRGGDNEFGSGGAQTKSISKFQEQWQSKTGKTMNDPQYQQDYAAWRKENTEVTA